MRRKSNSLALLILLLATGLGRTCLADSAAATQPASMPATTASPSTLPNQAPVGLSTITIPIEIPALSGTLFDRFQYSFHGQATSITEYHGDFYSPYQGTNSFTADHEVETSYTGTLFTGIKLFRGTEIYFDPEVSAGSGLSGVSGLGDPPNGETPRVSTPEASPMWHGFFSARHLDSAEKPKTSPTQPIRLPRRRTSTAWW